jgi:hypothetical protein
MKAPAGLGPAGVTFDNSLSAVNGAFRDFARQDERCLSRTTFAELDRANPMLRYALQPWPTFVGPRVMGQLEAVSVRLSQLIRTLPQLAFGGDPGRIAGHFDLSPDFVAATLSEPNGVAGAVSRADFILTAEGFRCIEFNIASSLGGWETGILAGILLRVPVIDSFLRERAGPFVHRSPVRALFRHCLRIAALNGHADGNVINLGIGMREAPPPMAERMLSAYLGAEYRAALREAGLEGTLLLCHYPALREEQGRLSLAGKRVDSLLEWHNHGTDAIIFRCFKAGNLDLYNGPASFILSDKRCISLLSEGAETGMLEPADAELVSTHIPWTRRVLSGIARYRGSTVTLPDFAVAQRPRLVLKKAKATSAGGSDVVLGRSSTDAQWADILRRALEEGDWVAQELVVSQPFLYQNGDRGCSPHDAIWGPFVFGDTFAGASLRVQPKEKEGIVNLHRGATVGIVLEVAAD